MRASGPDAVRQLTKFARGLGEPPRGPHSSSLARTGRIDDDVVLRVEHLKLRGCGEGAIRANPVPY